MGKTKISVTIDESVIERVDRLAQGSSRSEVVERALKRWLDERGRRRLDEEIAEYYKERRREEQLEDEEWAQLSSRHLKKSWK